MKLWTLILTFILLPMMFSTMTHAASLESSMTKRPGYFQSMWEIARFYIGNRWNERNIEDSTPNLNSHFEFLSEKRTQNNMGKMTSVFDKELQTRLYYSATSKPNQDGTIPIVDRSAKGLVVYFHGSGTENGSGSNFNYKGNKISVLGYSSLSMDYPFHQDGPINSKYGDTKFYMKYLLRMIEKYRIPGQPVILVGHSFGVNVISEFITRYPFAADSAVLLSPAGFNPELSTWAREKTTLMLKSFPHFVYNEMGSRWAGFINRGFVWNKIKNREFIDPTIVNPKLKVRIVSGEWEEFIPGPLDQKGLPAKTPRTYDVLGAMKKFFSKATTVLEPEVGHLVHSHIDKNGHDLVVREILAANNESVIKSKEIAETIAREQKGGLTEIDLAIQKQKLEPFFREWLSSTYGKDYLKTLAMMKEENEATKIARRILGDFKKFEDWRHDLILQELKTKLHPFYVENKDKIDSTIKSKNLNDRTQVINAYYIYLSQTPEAQQADVVKYNLVQEWKTESAWNFEQRTKIEAPARDLRKAEKKDSLILSCQKFYKGA